MDFGELIMFRSGTLYETFPAGLYYYTSFEKSVDRMKTTVNTYYREHKAQVALWLLLTAVVSVLAPLKTFQLKWLIDSSSREEAFFYIGIVVLICIGSHTFELLSRRVYTKIAAGAVHHVRSSVVDQALSRPYQQFSTGSDAAYLSLLSSDARILYDDYYMGIFETVFWGGIMMVSMFLFLYLSPVLLLIAILTSVPTLVIPKIVNARLVKARSDYSTEMEVYTGHLKELLGGYEVIRNFLREAVFKDRHRKDSRENSQKECRYQQNMNSVVIASSLISNLALSLMLLVGILMVYNGKITLGTMTSATNLITFVTTPCQRITQAYAKLKGTKAVREKFELAMNQKTEEDVGGVTIDDIGTVTCRNVAFAYPGTQEKVLQDVSLEIGQNEKVAVIGESGSGKSTLAKLLYQYYPEYEGSITYDGHDLKKIDRRALYQKVGYMSQSTFLFNDSIRNNICLFEPFTDQQLENAITLSGLRGFVDSLPDGVDTILEENGRNISGGQRQRIGIARMVIRQYQLVIADEITANLDVETTEQVMENLLSLPCAMVVITHNTAGKYMDLFDHVYQMQKGLLRVPAQYT